MLPVPVVLDNETNQLIQLSRSKVKVKCHIQFIQYGGESVTAAGMKRKYKV